VDDLFTYFQDGVMLLQLIKRVFPSVQLPRFNEAPKLRVQMLDNCTVALELLEQLNVKVPFLKATSLVNGEERAVMGLIWVLIYNYSLAPQAKAIQQRKRPKKMEETIDREH
jgi:hypothetical protein